MKFWLLFLWILGYLVSYMVSGQVEIVDMVPFGEVNGDLVVPPNDDGFVGPMTLNTPFPFFNDSYSSLFVNVNGAISFRRGISAYVPICSALDKMSTMIAPYWTDIDLRDGGKLYYRESTNTSLLTKIEVEVRKAFPKLWGLTFTSLYVATWHKVQAFWNSRCGQYPQDLTNTFQVVLATNRIQSFVLFYYNSLHWTTGTATESGGDCRGLGGRSAKAGFDVGDGVTFHEIPGSCTSRILHLVNSSNVGEPGKWIFRVDNQLQGANSCHSTGDLTVTPAFVNPFATPIISVRGPCFNSTNRNLTVTCHFSDNSDWINGTALVDFRQSVVYCAVPYIRHYGRTALSLSVGNVSYHGYVYMTEPQIHVNASFWPNNTLELRWHKNVFDAEAKLLNVTILTYDNSSLTEMPLVSNIPNTGLYLHDMENRYGLLNMSTMNVMLVPSISRDRRPRRSLPAVASFAGSYLMRSAILHTLFNPDLEGTLRSIGNTIESIPGRISGVLCVLSNSGDATARCNDWYATDPGVSQEGIEPCPPTERQARVDRRFKRTNPIVEYFNLKYFHSGAVSEYRQVQPSKTGAGQQCVYTADGRLLADGPGRGTIDAASSSLHDHWTKDVKPYCDCCKYSNNCDKYFDKRPADSGLNYVPSTYANAVGDPHLTTFDGFSYMFNGVGEFWMVNKTEGNFSVQGRMVPFGLGTASICTAYVITDDSTKLQIQASSSGMDILLDGILVPFPRNVTQLMTKSVTVLSDPIQRQIDVTFSSGFTFTFTRSGRSLNLQAGASRQNRGKIVGLLGNFDHEPKNDLVTPNGTYFWPNSTGREIHYDFGLKWAVTQNESLFIYGEGTNWSNFSDPEFTPWFETELPREIPANVASICGNSFECLFDWAASNGDLDFAMETRQSIETFNQIIKESLSDQSNLCTSTFSITNGLYAASRQGNVVEFECNTGFQLVGTRTLECIEIQGQPAWNGEPPRCDPIAPTTTPGPTSTLNSRNVCQQVVSPGPANSSKIYVREGCSLTLTCQTHFLSPNSYQTDRYVKWTKDGAVIGAYAKNRRTGNWQWEVMPVLGVKLEINESVQYKILISDVSHFSSGIYECTAVGESDPMALLRTTHFVHVLDEDEPIPSLSERKLINREESTNQNYSLLLTELGKHADEFKRDLIILIKEAVNKLEANKTSATQPPIQTERQSERPVSQCLVKGDYCGLVENCCAGMTCLHFYCRTMH